MEYTWSCKVIPWVFNHTSCQIRKKVKCWRNKSRQCYNSFTILPKDKFIKFLRNDRIKYIWWQSCCWISTQKTEVRRNFSSLVVLELTFGWTDATSVTLVMWSRVCSISYQIKICSVSYQKKLESDNVSFFIRKHAA